MKISLLKSSILIFIFFQVCSCTPPLYYPNSINNPMFSKKGQVAFNGSIDGIGGNVQFAMAPAQKFAFLINANWGSFEDNNTSQTYSGGYYYSTTYKTGHDHKFFEAGGGYFGTLGKNGRYEAFGLIGFGDATSFNESYVKDGKYNRYALQGDIGVETKAFEGVFSTRVGYLYLQYHDNRLESANQGSMFVDPALTIKLGWPAFKFFGQLGFDIPFNRSITEWEDGWAAFGIQVKI